DRWAGGRVSRMTNGWATPTPAGTPIVVHGSCATFIARTITVTQERRTRIEVHEQIPERGTLPADRSTPSTYHDDRVCCGDHASAILQPALASRREGLSEPVRRRAAGKSGTPGRHADRGGQGPRVGFLAQP